MTDRYHKEGCSKHEVFYRMMICLKAMVVHWDKSWPTTLAIYWEYLSEGQIMTVQKDLNIKGEGISLAMKIYAGPKYYPEIVLSEKEKLNIINGIAVASSVIRDRGLCLNYDENIAIIYKEIEEKKHSPGSIPDYDKIFFDCGLDLGKIALFFLDYFTRKIN